DLIPHLASTQPTKVPKLTLLPYTTLLRSQDEDALKKQMREDAEKRVKTNLTLEAIAKAEDIEATDDDVNEELENMASQYNMEVDQLKQMLGGNTDAIKEDLKLKKTIDYLVEHSQTA